MHTVEQEQYMGQISFEERISNGKKITGNAMPSVKSCGCGQKKLNTKKTFDPREGPGYVVMARVSDFS